MLLELMIAAATVLPAPCTSATPGCTEWIKPTGKHAKVLVYRSYSLETRNENITRALVFVHGILRDADNHFRTALAAGFLAGALNDTVIVAPRFASNSSAPGNKAGNCHDAMVVDEANWVCDTQRTDSWRSGGTELGNDKLSSFAFMDEILRHLARKELFPNLRAIVVAGHSAGGVFVIRYEMLNQVHSKLGVPVSYIVSNPSTYAYVDDLRPTANALPTTVAAGAPGYSPPRSPAEPAFVAYGDAKNCTQFNTWPFGLNGRTGYSSELTDEQVTEQLVKRPVTYLLGEADVLPLGVFDGSCPAVAQGPTRLGRGLAFSRYVTEMHGAQHKAIVVPFCGHSARCMFTSDVALPLMFPKVDKP